MPTEKRQAPARKTAQGELIRAVFEETRRPLSPREAHALALNLQPRIGIATVPAQRIAPTADADKLQAALLAKPAATDRHVGLTLAGCAVAVAVMSFFGWLPGAGA